MKLRRSIISSLMALSIISAAPAAAQSDAPPMLDTLISDFVVLSIKLAATDMEGDADAYRAVSDDRSKALVALAFYQPSSLTGLAAKLSALIEFSEDTERWSLRVTVEDMNRLADGGAK